MQLVEFRVGGGAGYQPGRETGAGAASGRYLAGVIVN
jgi:hypothetical protein